MNYAKLAKEIIDNVGGESNIVSYTHCMTRLRFILKDVTKADDVALKKLTEVVGVVNKGGQYQVIIGPEVSEVYLEAKKIVKENKSDDASVASYEKKEKSVKKGPSQILDNVMGALASCMTPLIPILLCAGFSKTVAAVFGPQLLGWFSKTSDLYNLFTFVGDAGFYFLPVFVGYTAAKRFGTSEVMGLLLGTIMIHPYLIQLIHDGGKFSVYGLPIILQNYTSTVLPMVLIVWVMSYVESFFKRITPNTLKTFGVPFGTLLVMLPLALGVLGPLGGFLGTYIGNGLIWLHATIGPLGVAVVAASFSLLVMTGMHTILIAFLFMTFAQNGFDSFLMPAMLVSSWTCVGVAVACVFQFKNRDKKSTTISYLFTWFLGGVGEPLLYGLFARYKQALYAQILGGFIAGLIVGFLGLKAHVLNPSSGVYGLAAFFGGSKMNYLFLVISVVVSFVVSFIAMTVIKLTEEQRN
ncbi:hypothetical protein RU86_GL000007 [Lactococcus piscium]|uniref:Uncharacterized protein n=1 Tax=Pseudolactococcus piscium TaxID=1364 RepID=A0A2A5S5Q9_9LACT|nr:PTS transporter subunit EIIC [Lactococcus piscium]PCS08771.1 hypothetical protein RU86_GL000007 [Lactococcus piscium]